MVTSPSIFTPKLPSILVYIYFGSLSSYLFPIFHLGSVYPLSKSSILSIHLGSLYNSYESFIPSTSFGACSLPVSIYLGPISLYASISYLSIHHFIPSNPSVRSSKALILESLPISYLYHSIHKPIISPMLLFPYHG